MLALLVLVGLAAEFTPTNQYDDVCGETGDDPVVRGARWGDPGQLLLVSDRGDLLWILEVNAYVGQQKRRFTQDIGVFRGDETGEYSFDLPRELFPELDAIRGLIPLHIRAFGLDAAGQQVVKSRVAVRFAAFHDGIHGPVTLYTESEWPDRVPNGLVHPTDEMAAIARDLSPNTLVLAPIEPHVTDIEPVEFDGKDLPEHLTLPEDDEAMIAATLAQREAR